MKLGHKKGDKYLVVGLPKETTLGELEDLPFIPYLRFKLEVAGGRR